MVDSIRRTPLRKEFVMATFYVLPSRHLLGQRFAEILTSLFPDAKYTPWDWPDLAASIAGLIEEQGSAQLDDETIEIELGAELLQFFHVRWATEKRRHAA
jgi:hypothetical protein